jgi:hypothetical protein
MVKFMHIFCELPEKTKHSRAFFIAAFGLFVLLAVFFYGPVDMDWQAYGTADWDYSNFMHAVPAWTIKYFHEFPLWNPYLRGGCTLIGNPQNPSVLSLTFLLSLLAGPVVGIKLGNILNAVVGMTGMYVLMGYFETIWIARILAAVVLAFNGTVAYHISQGHFMWMMTMYWPWMMLFFLKGLKKRLWMYPAALMLSLQFWGAATYPFAFVIWILVLLTVLFALRDKKIGYLLRFAEMIAAFVVFCAPRLFMVMETLYRFPRVTLNDSTQVPWSVFYYAFLCQDQIHNHVAGLYIDEFSAYVGLIPCALAAVLFFHWKKFWPYLCVLLFSLIMALGNSPYSPFWPVFHALGSNYFHFSTRSFLMSVFFISLACGFALSYLVLRWRGKYPWVTWLACAGVIFVIYNLFAVLLPTRKFTITNACPYEEFQPLIPFSQQDVTQKQEFRFGNSFMMDLLLRNTATANGYDALPIPIHVHAKNAPGHRGEFYLQNGSGQLELAGWSPNQWDVKLQVPTRDILVVNQNFDFGWTTRPAKKLLNVNGLLGVEVTQDDSEIVFQYLPFNFILGLWVSLFGLIAIGWDVLTSKRTTKNTALGSSA